MTAAMELTPQELTDLREFTGQPDNESAVRTAAHEFLRTARTQRPSTSPAPPQTAGIRRFFGIVDLGDPHGADNDRIDADLAREYGNGLGEA